MEQVLIRNLKNGKYFFGGFVAFTLFCNWVNMKRLVKVDIFGYDGNGGDILKIITDLTDEEMARLKYGRRTNWHFRGVHRGDTGANETILP
jgi:hypothetical protein